MPIQRLIHAVPIAISPPKRITFARAVLVPGVSIRTYAGRFAKDIQRRAETFPEKPSFAPTHLLVVDQSTYLEALDTRLENEGLKRPTSEYESLDIRGISRQILIAVTLVGRVTWQVGGYHCFDNSDPDFPYSSAGYSHAPTSEVSGLFRYSAPDDWFKDIRPSALRTTTAQLDCYYRSGVWWNDRLSVALGYLWSALTTTHYELSFSALCMALEAITTAANTEVTHTLAERGAILARSTIVERHAAYNELKQLYGLRSNIVHGRSAPRKGPITWETLAITAKSSMVPRSKVFRMLSYVIDAINGVLANDALLKILHTRQNEASETKAIDEHFLRLLLR